MTYPTGWDGPGYFAAQLLPETVPTDWKAPVGRPGIVPPRPLQFGDILGGAFQAVRAAPTTMFGLTLVVVLVVQLIAVGLGFALGNEFGPSIATDAEDYGLGSVVSWTTIASTLATSLTSFVVGIGLMHAVHRAVQGHRTSPSEALRHVGAWLWPTLGLSVLTGAGVLLLAGIAVGPLALGDDLGLGLGALLIPVALGLGAWLGVKLLLAPCVVALEGVGPLRAIRRSWTLTRGMFWRLAGIYISSSMIISIAAGTVSSVFSLGAGLLAADNFELAMVGVSVASTLTSSVLSLPLTYGVLTLLYVDARIRREGYDLQLSEALYG